jgi:prepilin-type processing-associated H-X9-DG protein
MNALFGLTGDTPSTSSANGRAWFNSAYVQFLKQTDVRQPANTWVTLDEHADSVNDAFFIVGYPTPTSGKWGDLPGSYHNGACGFSFADGHAENHKWRSGTSIYGVHYDGGLTFVKSLDAVGLNVDYAWYNDHTGYTLYR